MKILSQYSLLFLILCSQNLSSQNNTVKGITKYNFKHSKIYLANAYQDRYYEKGKVLDSSTVDNNGNFEFKPANLKANYPYKFFDRDENGYTSSSVFFVTSKDTNVHIYTIDSLSVNHNDKFLKENKEYDLSFLPVKKRYNQLYKDADEAVGKYGGMQNVPKEYFASYDKQEKEIIADEKKILSDYIGTHPDSNIAFWKFVDLFEKNLFSITEAESIVNRFSKDIKQSFYGKEISGEIRRKKILSIGHTFPLPKVSGLDQKPVAFKLDNQKKYTLVEFWFSHCLPCRRDLPKYKELYNKYNPKGFTIINIATDRKKDLPYLNKTIKDFEIPWTQYLDENGEQATRWGINSYPTNFLLNNKNEIVLINVSVDQLNNFLLKNVSKDE
ncbi:TlpA family protein disulfide reductase [Chryseobacterium sp. MIQD13]|uniref:TlpA family protein disulfide reductase n=1 Tax=Chryseobacterium sp. MIQD13 TaxID=3422310 RepID=UPI003D2B0553